MLLAEAFWSSLFEMPQIAIVMGCLVSIAVVLGIVSYQVERVKSNNELKRSLVDRGMSSEEIERIMEAGEEEKG